MGTNQELFHLAKYGTLYMDRVIFDAGYPVLFTCTDDRHHLFLCVCCQNNKQGRRWLVCRSSAEIILEMLNDKTSIRDSLLKDPIDRFFIYEACGESPVELNDVAAWEESSVFLPKKDEFLDAEPGEFDEEIRYYEGLSQKTYTEEYEYSVSNFMSLNSEDSEPLFDIAAIAVEEVIKRMPTYLERYLEVLSHINIEWDIDSKKMVYDIEPDDSDALDAA